MDVAGVVAQVAVAAVLLLAGLSKVRGRGRLRDTLEALGIGRVLGGPAAAAVVAAELAAAAGLLLAPTQRWPRAMVVLLAVAFALAGIAAMAGGQRIACNCLGSTGRGTLGWHQVVLLPLWLLLVSLTWRHPPAWSAADGILILSGLVLSLACWQAVGLAAASRRLRGDRRAIDEGVLLTPATIRGGQP